MSTGRGEIRSERCSAVRDAAPPPSSPEDAAALRDLYESLDVDDRYWRFFSARLADVGFYTDLTTVEERGGARFVAVLLSPAAGDRIIGEAGYSLLSNGDGELSVTVEHEVAGASPGRWTCSWRLLRQPVCRTWRLTWPPLNHADLPPLARLSRHAARAGASSAPHRDQRPNADVARTTPSRVLVEAPGARWHAEDQGRFAGLECSPARVRRTSRLRVPSDRRDVPARRRSRRHRCVQSIRRPPW